VDKTGDSLGGDVKYTLLAKLVAPLPIPVLNATGFKFQAFANAGNLLSWTSRTRAFLAESRLSLGVGVLLSLGGMARLEANYAVPVRKNPSDVEQRWQIGLATNI